jgi:hypothetical protein
MRFPIALLAVATLFPTSTVLAGDPPEGLRLEARAVATTVDAGDPISISVRLVNGSKTATHRVVRPNDGSESDLREPYVHWSVARVGADGQEVPLEGGSIGRYCLWAYDWTKDVVRLSPGEAIDIDWIGQVWHTFDVREAGRYRIVARYAWRGGKPGRASNFKPPAEAVAASGMAGVAPYELMSNAIDVVVSRPVDVIVAAKVATVRSGQAMPLSEFLEIRVENHTGRARRVTTDIGFDCLPPPDHAPPTITYSGNPSQERVLPDGAIAPAFGSDFPRGSSVTFTVPGVYRVMVTVGVDDKRVRSNRVDVTVVE